MAHEHRHDHDHAHPHAAHQHRTAEDVPRLRIALVLTGTYFVAELIGGFVSNSLALLADAGHMLADVGALALALFVAAFVRRAESPRKTYGYLRWEILAAFLNGAMLLLISSWIVWEAFLRLRAPEPLRGGLMLVVASIGLVVNVVAARVLHGSHGSSLNVRGAYLHVLADLLGSIGTIAAALIIRATGWLVVDPIVSVLVTLLVVRSAWRLVRESVDVLLESTPAHVPLGLVRRQLEDIPGIESVHDLHVWTVTSGVIAMSAHAIVREPERHQHVLEHVHDAMKLFGISHVTIQLERSEMYSREMHLHP